MGEDGGESSEIFDSSLEPGSNITSVETLYIILLHDSMPDVGLVLVIVWVGSRSTRWPKRWDAKERPSGRGHRRCHQISWGKSQMADK